MFTKKMRLMNQEREAPLFICKREVRIALSRIDQGLRDKSWRERMWTAASARER